MNIDLPRNADHIEGERLMLLSNPSRAWLQRYWGVVSICGATGSQLAAVANRARQRKKGPLVRFGRKYER